MASLKKEKTILEILSELYIIAIILFFPLMINKTGYFKILECKWHSYLIISSIYLTSIIGVLTYFFIIKKINYFKTKKLNKIQIFLLIYIMINIISCLISPYYKSYNLFIGVGRGEGLIMVLLYTLTFLSLTFFTKFKERYLVYFSLSSIFIGIIGFLQYLGFNPFNLYQEGIGIHNVSFLTTIGNIDFVSGIYCILLPISILSFLFIESKKYKLIHLISIFFGMFIIFLIDVQSGQVSLLLLSGIITPFLIISNKTLSRFLMLMGSVILTFTVRKIIDTRYIYSSGLYKISINFDKIVLSCLILSLVLFILAFIMNKTKYEIKNKKRTIKITYILIIVFILSVLAVIYFCDFKTGLLYEIHELLNGNFDDKFGTYRIFLWKRTLKIFLEYPLLGSGPDSFAIRFMAKYTQDIASIGPLTINDTAANVYLTMLINIGIIGLLSYLIFIASELYEVIKNKNKYSLILGISVICFLCQDFFNLTTVIYTPLFWILQGVLFSTTNHNYKLKK